MRNWIQPLSALVITGLTASAGAQPGGDSLIAPLGLGFEDKPAQEASTDNTLIKTYFKDGLRFETADKGFQMKMGGRIMFDTALIGTNNNYMNSFGNEENGSSFREARIYAEGSFNEKIEFKWQYDFNGGVNNKLKDLYIGFRNTPAGNVRVGQFKEPFGLDQLTSLSYITFMERGAPNALVPGRNVGVMLFDNNAPKTMNWAVGIFEDDGADTGASTGGDGAYSLTGRVSGTPVKDDVTHLIHLGASASTRTLGDNPYAVTFRGESNLTKGTIASVNVAADSVNMGGVEAAWVNGPLSLQSEYILSQVNPDAGEDLNYTSFYVYGSYFLTGESRTYKDTTGTFTRIDVLKPYGKDGGMGAVELALRVSGIDLDDGTTPGGQVTSYTAGVNWYLTAYMRFMVNYVHEEIEISASGDGVGDILQARIQIDV